jgi:hypothetical protein
MMMKFQGFRERLFMAIGIEMGRVITLLGYFGIYFERKEYSLMWEL